MSMQRPTFSGALWTMERSRSSIEIAGWKRLCSKITWRPPRTRAWFARKHVAGLKVFGGIALNSPAGGINPDAVNWMARMQGGYGRLVWFPTFDSDNHVKHFKDAPEAIKVLGADGKVLPA